CQHVIILFFNKLFFLRSDIEDQASAFAEFFTQYSFEHSGSLPSQQAPVDNPRLVGKVKVKQTSESGFTTQPTGREHGRHRYSWRLVEEEIVRIQPWRRHSQRHVRAS